MSILSTFSRLVGVPDRFAEDALHSERAARHTLSRRGMMGALAAMAAGSVMPLPAAGFYVDNPMPIRYPLVLSWSDLMARVDGFDFVVADIKSIHYEGLASDIGCHI